MEEKQQCRDRSNALEFQMLPNTEHQQRKKRKECMLDKSNDELRFLTEKSYKDRKNHRVDRRFQCSLVPIMIESAIGKAIATGKMQRNVVVFSRMERRMDNNDKTEPHDQGCDAKLQQERRVYPLEPLSERCANDVEDLVNQGVIS